MVPRGLKTTIHICKLGLSQYVDTVFWRWWASMRAHAHKCHAQTFACVHMRTNVVHTHLHACTCAQMSCTHICMRAHAHKCHAHTFACVHMRTHAMHTHWRSSMFHNNMAQITPDEVWETRDLIRPISIEGPWPT